MANRLFVGGAVVLWLASMGWLVVDRVLPSFSGGDPPSVAGFDLGTPVGWRVYWAERPVGWAASVRSAGVQGTTELHNRVELSGVPLLELAPAWLQHVVGDIGNLKFSATTRLEFDSLDHFTAFESHMTVNDVPGVLTMRGRMKDDYLQLKIRSGDVSYAPRVYIPNESALSEALFPDAKLPHLYIGRKWQEEVYNPFRSLTTPVEYVDAEVTGEETVQIASSSQRALRVEFRTQMGPGVPDASRLQAIAWIEPLAGTVLRQDVMLGRSQLRFERLSDAEASEVGQELFATIPGLELPNGRNGERSRAPVDPLQADAVLSSSAPEGERLGPGAD